MSSTNESRCTAATVTSFGHLPVPGRPGVYFIPHRLVQMDGAPCGVAAASAAAGTGRVASTAAEAGRERLSQWTEEEARELLAGPGTLVTRRRNVLSEAAAIAAGTDDLWGIVQTMSNAVGLIGLFDAVDLWVGVERDAPRVCGASAMGAGSVWLWLRVPDGAPVAEILSIGLTMRAGEQLLFGINERGQRVCAWSRTDADTYVPTPQPTAPPQAQATPKWGSPSCFPAAAAVTRADGSTAAMADVVVGDALRVAVAAAGDAGASRVYMFAHRLAGGTYDFVQLTTSDGAAPTLTLSPGHLVYLADGRLVAAADVVPGDGLQRAAPLALGGGAGNGTAAPPAVWVRAASHVQRRGLYNPLTLHGDLIVDGYRVSTFTTDVPPVVGAVLSAPLRALYVVMGLSTTLLEAGVDRLAPLGAAVATVVVAGGELAAGSALRRRTE